MYDYMKALQERFDEKQPEHLVYAVQSAREGLRDGIDAESRRKLLRLLDAQNALLAESKLMSFTAGFKLAAGIAGELGAPYSFDADDHEVRKSAPTARATSANAQTDAGRGATPQAITQKPESASSKMCLVKRRRNARQSSVPQWKLPEESMSAVRMSTR